MSISIGDFILKRYNNCSIEHKSTIISLCNDPQVQKFIGNLENMVYIIEDRGNKNNYDRIYIIYKENEPVGFISSSLLENGYDIRYAILKEFRKQGIASIILKHFSEYLFLNYPDIQEINLDINERNEASLKTAEKVGYKKKGRVNYYIDRKLLTNSNNVNIMCDKMNQESIKTYVELYYTRNGLITNLIRKEVENRDPKEIFDSYDSEVTKFRFYDEITQDGIKQEINYSPMIYFGKKEKLSNYLYLGNVRFLPYDRNLIRCYNGEIIYNIEAGAITSEQLLNEIEKFNKLELKLKNGQN